MRKQKSEGYVRASFTIEAAVIVPIVLAVIFLLLQVTMYLHDTIWTEAWLSGQAWNARWTRENERQEFVEIGEGNSMGECPRLAVLRCGESGLVEHSRSIRAEARFQIQLLPQFVTIIFDGQPDEISRQVTEKVIDTPQFLKIVGVILEEKEGK